VKVYNVELRNIGNINMSNWQITHVVNSFTVANNKFDVLNKMNKLISDGMDKKIFLSWISRFHLIQIIVLILMVIL
jgi:hypothetical protein